MNAQNKASAASSSASSAPTTEPVPCQKCAAGSHHKDEVRAAGSEPTEEPEAWVEVAVTDETGAPLPNVRCEITDSAGKVLVGSSNDDGVVRFAGLAPGQVTAKVLGPASSG
ncbi:MAG: carboxypeptidase regulatory-like domain-containing protein [Myxococcales bacterium]|nr:carboxypeptidase regulatory-like domain-containing protein [Myxococcales bacterium]